MKPRSFLRYLNEEGQRKLNEEAKPHPRVHFRGSELGGCARKIAYDMMGMRPRPLPLTASLIGKGGNAYHDTLQAWMGEHFIMEGVEGEFSADEEVKRVLINRVLNQGRADSIEIHENSRGGKDFHVKFTHKDRPLEIHFRPDGIAVGLQVDAPDLWDPSEWSLIEIKSTTEWGFNSAKTECHLPNHPYGWHGPFVLQAQIYMHFLGLEEARLWQVHRDRMEMIMDDTQTARKLRVGWKSVQSQDWDWEPIPYDPEIVESMLDRMAWIRGLVEENELPPGECSGSGYIFNSCSFNTTKTAGFNSEPMCGGKDFHGN